MEASVSNSAVKGLPSIDSEMTEVLSIMNEVKKYEQTVGMAYDELPAELCEGTNLKLAKWSLVVTDNSLKNIAALTHNRVKYDLENKGKGGGKKLTLEEELAQLEQLSFEPEEEVEVKPVVSKKMTSLERTIDESIGGDTGLSAEEQNMEEENYMAQVAAADRVKWENQMKKTGLLSLDITGSQQVTDTGVKAIADVCITLKSLSLEGAYKVTDVGLRALSMGCVYIRELNLSGCMGIVGPGFSVIGQSCRMLTGLKLSGCRQIPPWVLLNIFDGCRQLEELDLSDCSKLGDHEVKCMAEKCNVLRKLNLKECKQVSDVGVLAVSQGCPMLEELDLSRSELQFKITDVCLLALGERCSVLRKLNLNGCEMVTDAGLSWLAKGCPGLEWIDITNCNKVTNGGMRCLGEGCPDLNYCILAHLKKVTDVGLRFLVAGCSQLKVLNCTGMFLLSDGMKRDFGFEGLQALGRSPCALSLTSINLTGCFQVSTTALKSLSMLVNIETLCLSGCVNLTAKGMGYLAETMGSVRSLSLAFCGDCITDAMMGRCLKKWTRLSSIIMTECDNIGVGTMRGLSHCKNLRRVDLTGCKGLEDTDLIPFCEASYWPGISALYLTGCAKLGNTGLNWIADGLKNAVDETTIVTLSLKGTRCTRGSLNALKDRYKYSEMKWNDSFFGMWPLSRATDRMVIDNYGLVYRSATKLQSVYRAKKDRQYAWVKKEEFCREKAARLCQARWRGRMDRAKARNVKKARNMRDAMATRIQNMYTAWKGRKWLRDKRKLKWIDGASMACTEIQKMWRGVLGRMEYNTIRKQRMYILELQSKASVEIQKICRYHLAQLEFARRKDAKLALERLHWNKSWMIQCVWRMFVARRDVERQRVQNEENWNMRMGSATMIQIRYRSYRCRTVLSNKVRDRKESILAATYVQSCWRARLAWLEVETKRQIWLAEQESKAALVMQRAWRRKAAQKLIEMMKEEKKRMVRERQTKAGVLQRWWRGVIARREAAELKKQYLAQLRRMADLENWGSTIIAAAWRGKGGRDLWRERMWARKARWKEMWSEEETRKFYYNQISGEIRYRKPQDLLDLMKRPICNNCEFYEARVECSNCKEFYCHQCWDSVHFGGKRAKHGFRNLYDYYEKRVDYGDGEFPSTWPSEIEQDEFSGWRLRIYPARKPHKVIGDWEIYLDEEGEKFFYHNRMKHINTYEKPEDLKVLFTEDWDGEGEGGDEEEEGKEGEGRIAGEEKKEETKRAIVGKAPAPEEDEEPAEELWEGWGKYWDEDSNSFYYFNTDSGTSQYERPEDFETQNDPFMGVRGDIVVEDIM